jgi:beta-glucosidase-like glycosyl hydrolase
VAKPRVVSNPWKRGAAVTDPGIEKILDKMTLAEQVALLSGEDFWSLPAIPRLGIGKLRVTDGPNGARGGGSLIGGVKSASFPVGIALGATWDPALVREIGTALGEEAKSKGAHVFSVRQSTSNVGSPMVATSNASPKTRS